MKLECFLCAYNLSTRIPDKAPRCHASMLKARMRVFSYQHCRSPEFLIRNSSFQINILEIDEYRHCEECLLGRRNPGILSILSGLLRRNKHSSQ